MSTYGVIATWLVGSAILSVFQGNYGSAPSLDRPERLNNWCLGRLTGLHSELEEHIAQAAGLKSDHVDTQAKWTQWSSTWKKRFSNLEEQCGNQPKLSSVFAHLGELHQGYSLGVAQVLKTREELSSSVRMSIRDLVRAR